MLNMTPLNKLQNRNGLQESALPQQLGRRLDELQALVNGSAAHWDVALGRAAAAQPEDVQMAAFKASRCGLIS